MEQETQERTTQNEEGQGQTGAPVNPQGNAAPPPSPKPLRISSPEQVDDYIRVTNPGMWLLAIAMVVLLAAGIIWGYAVKVEMKTIDENGQVTTEYVAPASFLTDGTIGK